VRQSHASRLHALNDVPEGENLLGTPVFAAYNIDVPGGIGDTPGTRNGYFESLSTMSIHTDGAMIDRILRPELKTLSAGPTLQGFKTGQSKRDEAERQKKAEEEAAIKSEKDRAEEKRLADKLHKLKLEMPPLNLLVVEVAIFDETPEPVKTKAKKIAPVTVKRPPGAKRPAPGAKKDTHAEEEEGKVVSRKLKAKLHQVIGIFSCDREISERAPPALDCGLLDWDHLLDMNDFSAYEKEVQEMHPLQWLVRPAKANYFLPLDKSTRPWSHPDESGTIQHVVTLESKKKFKMCLLGAPPEKEFLQGDIPRNIKTWLGMV